MLELLLVILIGLWLLGLVTATGGALIHVLLVVALVVFIVRMMQRRDIGP